MKRFFSILTIGALILPAFSAPVQASILSQVELLLEVAQRQSVTGTCGNWKMNVAAATVECTLIPLTAGFILYDLLGYNQYSKEGTVARRYQGRFSKAHQGRLEAGTYSSGINQLKKVRRFLIEVEDAYAHLDEIRKNPYGASSAWRKYKRKASFKLMQRMIRPGESLEDAVIRIHSVNLNGLEQFENFEKAIAEKSLLLLEEALQAFVTETPQQIEDELPSVPSYQEPCPKGQPSFDIYPLPPPYSPQAAASYSAEADSNL